MPLLETAPAIEPHITHLHLAGHVAPQPGEEYLYLADQLPALELLTSERLNPQAATVELVTTDGVSREVTVVNMLMEAYTRFGKFEVITADFRRYKQEHPEARGLYLAHATVLPRQSRMKFDGREMQRPPELRLTSGEFHGLRKDDTDVDMLFATIQSMAGTDGYRFPADYFDYIIVDEGHHTPAPTFKDAIVNHFKPKVRTTITGTLNRLDGLDITKIYGQPVVSVPLAEGFVRRRLRDLVYKVMLEESVRNRVEDGESTRAGMNRMTRSLDWNLSEMILRADDEIAKAGIKEPKVLHFAQNINQAEDIAALLGPDCVIMHSEQSDENNEAALQSFNRNKSEGGVSNIVSVNMLNEGVDIKCNVISFYRSTESEAVLLQQLGRGLQPAEDGSPLLVLDFVANAKRLELLYRLIHSITNYNLETDEYQVQPRSNEPSMAQLLEALRGFGVEIELDDELQEVMQSITDHEHYMEKIRRFEAVDEFDALAYVATSIGGDRPVMRSIEERAKRGEGPSIRALMSATGQTIGEMLASIAPMGLYRIHKNLNDIELGDLVILMAKDIVMRHPNSRNDLGILDTGKILWRYLKAADYNGPTILANPDGDLISVDGQDGSHCRIMPQTIVNPEQQGGGHFTDGWSVKIEDKDGTIDIFYPNSDQELNGLVTAKMCVLLGELSRQRQLLQGDEVATGEYPFYERRNRHELGLILDRFHGQDAQAEWSQYKERRAQIKQDARYTNMIKQAIRLASETSSHNLDNVVYLMDWRPIRLNEYEVKYETDARRIIIQKPVESGAGEALRYEIDINNNHVSVFNLDYPEVPAISGRIDVKAELKGIFNRMIGRKLQYVWKEQNQQRYHEIREQALTSAQEWLETFARKVNASQQYIDDTDLPDFDPFGDEIMGAYVEWPIGRRDARDLKWPGLVTGINYRNGTVDIAVGYGKDSSIRSSTFKILRKDKSGQYVKRAISKHFAVYPVTR